MPLEPYPGAGGGVEMKWKVRLPAEDGRITTNTEGTDAYASRRMRLTKKDLEKFGFTVGYAGSRAENRRSIAVRHTEECSKLSWESWKRREM